MKSTFRIAQFQVTSNFYAIVFGVPNARSNARLTRGMSAAMRRSVSLQAFEQQFQFSLFLIVLNLYIA